MPVECAHAGVQGRATRFKGRTYHTGHWPHEGVDFSGLRVGVIGTGSSAIQAIPVIAAQAKHLTVFQRTPNYSIPAANRPLSADDRREWKGNYPALRARAREMRNGIVSEIRRRVALEASDAERDAMYRARWTRGGLTFMTSFNDLIFKKEANDTAAQFVRDHIGEIVKDPAVAKLLQPTTYPIGTKRICIDTDYFETFNRDNVTLVDIREAPIEEITAEWRRHRREGIRARRDRVRDRLRRDDRLVQQDRHPRARRARLKEKWAAGPKTYLGLMVAGLPEHVHRRGARARRRCSPT